MKRYYEGMIEVLKTYKENKEKEGFIPTVEMLIEDLQEKVSENHE